ncbi:MAG: choice-of-anchor J domain-containing protein [Candidatus Cloacimonadaceae bacterium]
MKKILLFALALALTLGIYADVVIGTGTSNQRQPFGSYYGYERSASLYTAGEINATGTITHLEWYVDYTDDTTIPTKIYLTTTPNTTMTSTAWNTMVSGLTPVFDGNLQFNTGGWHQIDIADFPYNHQTSGNLLVICETNYGGGGSGYSTHPKFRYTTNSGLSGRHQSWNVDTNPPTSQTGTISSTRPNITLVGITDTNPPSSASVVSPADQGINIAITTSLSWSAGGGVPTGYDVYFGQTLPSAGNPTVSHTAQTTTTWSPGTLAYETTYYWKIVPHNAFGDAGYANCPTWSFTTGEDPTATPEYFVDFGTLAGDWPVQYWTQRNGFYPSASGTTAQWVQGNWLNGAATNKAARLNIYGTARNGWLITRPVNIPATGDYQLKFDLALMKWNAATPVTAGGQPDDKFMILMADDALMTTNLTVLKQWDNDESPNVFDDIANTGETVIVPLTGVSGIKYFAFYAESSVSNGDNDLMIDNVTVREAPAGAVFEITPEVTTWDFGPQIINTTQSKTFTVTNSGVADLTFSNVTVNGTYYSAQDAFDTTPLASGASRDFTVDYAPTVEGGPYEGSLVFTFSLRDSYTVDLSGECYDPTVLSFPWTENFDSVTAPAIPGGWTIIDANDDARTWVSYAGDAQSSPNSMRVMYHGTNATDDYAVSPPLSLTGGVSYQLDFYYRAYSASYTEKLKVMIGTAPTAEAMTTTVIDLDGFSNITYQRAKAYFTAPSTGIFYLGWHGYSDANKYYIYFDSVTISEAVDYDLAATAITGDVFAIAGTQTTHSVSVQNNGAQEVDSYTVYLKNAANDAILASETITTALAVDASNTVALQWTPQTPGDLQIYGEVSFALDETASNNATAPMDVKVYASDLMVESFEGTTFPPEGWMRTTSSTSYWTYSTTAFHGSRSMYAFTSTSLDYRISTPVLQIGTGSTIDFYARASNTSQVLKIQQSTDRETWQQIGDDITFTEANVWYPISIPLSELNNGNYYLAFYAPTHTTTGSIYVDLVVSPQAAAVVPGPVTLLTPADEATNVPVRPTLTWTAPTTGGLADEYKVYVGTSDTFSQNDLVATVETLTYTLETNLNYNTQYYWTVAASNDTGDSTNNPVFSFTTMPDPTITVFPFTEGFEDGYAHAQVVGQPWMQLTGPLYTAKSWTANNTETTYNRTPRSGDWNAYLQWGGQSALVRPIYLQSGYDYSMEFYARQDGATATNAWMTALLGSEPTLEGLDRVIVAQAGLVNGDYQRFFGQFTVLDSGVYYIGIQGWINSTPYYISLDDITITETLAVTAEPPILNYPVELSDMPKDGFDFSWIPDETGGAAELYILYIWDDEDYQLGDLAWETTATSFNPVLDEDNPMEFEYGKRYNWAVSSFKLGVESDLAESWFIIENDPVITLPFFEGFEDGYTHGQAVGMPWKQLTGTQFATKYWTANNTLTDYNRSPRSGDWNATLQYSGQSALVRPIDLTAGTNYYIRFYARQDGTVSSNAYVKALLGSAASLADLNIEILPQTNIINGDYQEMYAEFNVESSGRYYLGIQGYINNSPWYISLDDITIEEIVPYAMPASNPNPADGDTNINALPTLSWQNHGTIASFDLYLSTNQQAVSSLDSSALIVTGQTDPLNSHTLTTALDYGQEYFWSVVPKDGSGVPPTDPIAVWSFTTEADPRILSLPHAENFDDVTTPNFPRGWTPIKTNTSSSLYTSSTYSHTPSNSVYMYSYSASETMRLVTPEVMVPLNSIKVSFQLRSTGTTNYSLKVGTVDTPNADGVFTEIATINPTVSAAFEPHTVSFANYTGTDRYIAFQHGLGAAYQSMYLDTILLEELLTADMAATAISGPFHGFIDEESTFTITVQNAGSQTQNAYTVGLYSTDSGSPLATVNVTEELASFATAQHQLNWTPTALGNVTLYGKVTLAGDQNSDNNQTTNHNVTVYPQGILMEDFESGTIPDNWTVINADGGSQSWQVTTSNPHTGSYSANVRYETSSLQNDDWLITPPLKVTSDTTDEISFWLRTYNATSEDAWEVLISTTDTNPASFTMIDSGDGYLVNYVQKVYNLDSYGDAVIYLAVRYRGSYNWYMYVDDFFGPPIYVPESLDTPEVTLEKEGTGLKLSWEPIANSNHYKVYEADTPEGPWTLANTTTNTYYNITNPADRKFYQVQATTEAAAREQIPAFTNTQEDDDLRDSLRMRGLHH